MQRCTLFFSSFLEFHVPGKTHDSCYCWTAISTNLAGTVSKEILNFYINMDMSLFFKYSYIGVFHHYFNIPVNNSNEFYWVSHTHTHTHTQSLQLFTFNRLVFLLPDLSAQYLSTFFSFSIFSVFASAKSPQSCLTLCDPIDGSPPGSPVPGILQARTLKWVAISFSNAWKWKVKVKSLSHVWFLVTPWTAAHQAPPSMGFSRQEYWSGVPFDIAFIFSFYLWG